MGNAPSAVLNVLVASGGQGTYDIINIVGGMQKPLVENDLIEEIDTSRMPNWAKDSLCRGVPRQGKAGLPVHRLQRQDLWRADGAPGRLASPICPKRPGPLDSYAALFDPKWKGFVALEDNYTTAGQKTALYLKKAGLATIANPDDMTKEEFKTVIDFLIDQKKKGQFRVIWNSFEQAVNLITSKEVYVIDCWEPMVFVAKSQGHRCRLCRSEGGLSAVGDGGLHREESEPLEPSRRRPPMRSSISCWAAGTAPRSPVCAAT